MGVRLVPTSVNLNDPKAERVFLAKTDPRSSRTVSLRQLSVLLLYCSVLHMFEVV